MSNCPPPDWHQIANRLKERADWCYENCVYHLCIQAQWRLEQLVAEFAKPELMKERGQR
jgi:hypothetical protein